MKVSNPGVWPTVLCWILDGGVRHRQTEQLEASDLILTRPMQRQNLYRVSRSLTLRHWQYANLWARVDQSGYRRRQRGVAEDPALGGGAGHRLGLLEYRRLQISRNHWELKYFRTKIFTEIFPGEEESFGLLESDYSTVRHPWLVQQLQRVMPILSLSPRGI